jgi:NADH-quinone oxidoreductase subunit J
MTISEIIFYLFSAIIVLFSILTVTSRRILRAAIFLLFVLVSTAGLYFMLNYQFLAAVQLTLYAGGIVVLIIFSILLTSHISQKFESVSLKKQLFSAIAVAAGAFLSIMVVVSFGFDKLIEVTDNPSMSAIGSDLLNYGKNGYALPFEVISILLLAAMFASIVIAKKDKKTN